MPRRKFGIALAVHMRLSILQHDLQRKKLSQKLSALAFGADSFGGMSL
jgi:hypothetical protein